MQYKKKSYRPQVRTTANYIHAITLNIRNLPSAIDAHISKTVDSYANKPTSFLFQVQKPVSKSFPSGSGLQYTVLYLELRVEPAHMSNNGALILRCTSVVADRKQTAELSLGPRTSEPVPERGNQN